MYSGNVSAIVERVAKLTGLKQSGKTSFWSHKHLQQEVRQYAYLGTAAVPAKTAVTCAHVTATFDTHGRIQGALSC